MILENWTLVISFTMLLFGVFVLRKLWLGALGAILFVLLSKTILLPDVDFAHGPLISGSIISVELALLLFGAYLFYNTLSANGHFSKFMEVTSSLSSKLFVLIILCVFMGSFMEGIAGFGIPAMLIAPLLITLGFKPLTSIVLPLTANTTAVTFGALGTPLKVGLGIYESDSTVVFTLLLNSLPALAMPFLLAFLYSKTEQADVQWKKNWGMLLGAGFSFAVPYLLTGLLSVEYPSVVAGFVGLLLFASFFVPKNENPPFIFWMKTFYPYFLFVIFLLVAKYFLSSFYWNIDGSIRPLPLYQPGLVFIMTSIFYLCIIQKNKLVFQLGSQIKETFLKTGKATTTIFLLVCLSQLIQEDLSGITQQYYHGLNETTKIFVNPLIGVMGSFISGSATMSNLLFGEAIKSAESIGGTLPLFLALLHSGSAIGNSISLQNIIMVKSVVKEPTIGYASILQYSLLVVGLYVFTIILLSFLIIK
ncbi:L-lactate permease [Sphingobacterium olei]|uniref:L-lactate permease n=1 Tax=Sphingobacterium olei TaxID=2571155 RepID=A0A4V5MM85_9SPHI|nr:L-lactate permease [Sphingobacterium olei]TJZ60048.1 L-lactate permease [Sphingobacterium olei]